MNTMLPSPSKSDTTAFTNGLKQLFYIHKNIVADLRSKLENVSTAYEERMKSPQTSRKGKCLSCCQLEKMNRALQEQLFLRETDTTGRTSTSEATLQPLQGEIHDASGNKNDGKHPLQSRGKCDDLERKIRQPSDKELSVCVVSKQNLASKTSEDAESTSTPAKSHLLPSNRVGKEGKSKESQSNGKNRDQELFEDVARTFSHKQENMEQTSVQKGKKIDSEDVEESIESNERCVDGLFDSDSRGETTSAPSSNAAAQADVTVCPGEVLDKGPTISMDGDGVRTHSRLRLTRQGKRRSHYMEGKPDGKRRRLLSSPQPPVQNEPSSDVQLKCTSNEKENHEVTGHSNSVLVLAPETEQSLQDKHYHRSQSSVAICENNDEDDESDGSIASQQMLVVPETMAMDFSSACSNADEEGSTIRERQQPGSAEHENENNRSQSKTEGGGMDLSQDKSLFGHTSRENKEVEKMQLSRGRLNLSNNEDSLDDEIDEANGKGLQVPKSKSLENPINPSCIHSRDSNSPEKRTFGDMSSSQSTSAEHPSLKTDLKKCEASTGLENTYSQPEETSDDATGKWILCQKDSVARDLKQQNAQKPEISLSRKRTRSTFRTKAVSSDPGRFSSIERFFYPSPELASSKLGNSPGNKSLRQTTLSQAFDVVQERANSSVCAKTEKGKKSTLEPEEEDEQVAEAIRRSLRDIENQPYIRNTTDVTAEDPEIKAPATPSKTKSPKFKHKPKSPGKFSDHGKSPAKDQVELSDNENIENSPVRRSPRLLKLREFSPTSGNDSTLSSPHRKAADSARKGLFKALSSNSEELSRNSQIDVSPKRQAQADSEPTDDKVCDQQYSMTMCSLTPAELRVWNQREETGSQRSLRSSMRNKGRQSFAPARGQTWEMSKSTQRGATYDPNGSLNPDVHLSEYLHSEALSCLDRHQKDQASWNLTLATLDETVAPNLVSQYAHSLPTGPVSPSFKHRVTPKKKQSGQVSSPGHKHDKPTSERELGASPRTKKPVSPLNKDSKSGSRLMETGSNDEEEKKGGEINENENSVVFTDDEEENETVAPSPQQSLQFGSQPQYSIPSSSRSFKFVHKQPQKTKLSSSKAGHDDEDQVFKIPTVDVKVVDGRGNSMDVNQSMDAGGERFDPSIQELKKQETEADSLDSIIREPPAQSLWDSFDRVPQQAEPELPHVQVVRKKSERDKLEGFSCKQCYEYYKNSGLSEDAMKEKMNQCSRHRDRYEAPGTPEHFWSLGFPDTAEIQERKRNKDPEESPAVAARAPRRRKRLEKKF